MNRDFAEMLDALSDAGADFLVIGAHALAAHGRPRATGDLDLWVRSTRDNALRVWSALIAFGAPLGEITIDDLATPDVVFQIGVEPARIDIRTSVTGLTFDEAWSRRNVFAVEGRLLPFLSREDLIRNKTALGRPRDLADIDDLPAMSSTTMHPAQSQLGRLMTFEEWAAMDEDEPGELVDGRLEEEEVPDPIHEIIVLWLGQVLRNWLGRSGVILGSGAKYAVGSDRGRKPDVAVYLHPETWRPPARGVVRVPPDIAVEIVSPSPRDERRDRIEKMDEYAAFGVAWYWIIDPRLQSFEVLELSGGRYARAAHVTEGRLDTVPGCDGLQLDLDDLWSEIAQLDAPQEP